MLFFRFVVFCFCLLFCVFVVFVFCCFCCVVMFFCFFDMSVQTALGPGRAQRGQTKLQSSSFLVVWVHCVPTSLFSLFAFYFLVCLAFGRRLDLVWLVYILKKKNASYQNKSLKSSSFLFLALVFVAFWSGLGSNKSSASNKSGRHVCLCNLHMFIGSLAQLFRI